MGGRVGTREHDAFRIGQELRAARERAGWDLRDASAATAIPVTYLSTLEEGQLNALPGPVYARGYVRTYATALHLDGDAFTVAFCQLQPQGRFDRIGIAPARGPRRSSSGGPPRRLVRLLGFTLFAFLGLLVINAIWAAIGPDDGGSDSSLDAPARRPAGQAPPAPVTVAPTLPPGPLAPASSDSEGAVYAVGRDAFAVSVEPAARVWVQVRQTGESDVLFEGTLTSGENKTFQAAGQLWIRVGNQESVRVLLDGNPLAFPVTTDEPYNIALQK